MTSKPFHHGNLRAVLLEQAQVMLRTEGLDSLSLRDLARQAGVSHGAPRSHFIDRQALLDALAEQGFLRLTEKVTIAMRRPGTFEERFRLVGRAYVDFAVEEAALMDLMFASQVKDSASPIRDAAAQLFRVLDEALGPQQETPGADDARDRFKMLFAATMQGTATLIASRRISPRQGQVIIDDASDALLGSRLGVLVTAAAHGADGP